jgi:hypothetical protein
MSEVTAPVEAVDPFQGGEPSFAEFSKYRQDGTIPERFKAKTDEKPEEAPAQPEEAAKPQTGEEPVTEQEKAKERDDKGKFTKKVEFSTEQQEVFDREFRKREAKIRREFEQKYAAQPSEVQPTAGEKQTSAAESTEPKRPEPPDISTYSGTLEEFNAELKAYPAKLQAFLDAKHEYTQRVQSVQQKLAKTETEAYKAHPDYKEEFEALVADINADTEPKMPAHVMQAIQNEADDPHEITYHLAKNREEYRKFASLSPEAAAREVIRLDTRLSFAKSAPAPVKEAPKPKPKPPEPVGTRQSTSAFDVNDESLSADEWARQRTEQRRKQGHSY